MNPLEARRRLLGRNVYKRTTEGNPAIAQGSLARMYPGITMQGWTEQNGTPTPEAPVPIVSAGNWNEEAQKWEYEVSVGGAQLFDASRIPTKTQGGATITNNGDGSFTISGNGALTETFSVMYYLTEKEKSMLTSGKLKLNIEQKTNPYFVFGVYDSTGNPVAVVSSSISGGVNEINLDECIDGIKDGTYSVRAWFYGVSGGSIILSTVSPMIYQFGNGIYEPYRTPQTVTLTADRPLTKWDKLEKRNGQWGWVYGSVEVDMSSEVTWDIHQGYEQETSNLFRGVMSGVDKIDPTDAILCNILPYYQAASVDVNGIYPLGNNLYARIVGIKSLEDFREKIQGGKVLVKLSTETFVPLTTTEQEAMNALYTFRPTTVLSNDEGCEMSLTYKTKKSLEVTT